MKQLLLAAGLAAIFATTVSAQEVQKQFDPNHKQGTQGQRSSGTQQKSAPSQPPQGTAQPQAKSVPPQINTAPTPPPSKSVVTPPPVQKSPPPQRTIILQPMPSVPFHRSHGYSERRHNLCQKKAWELHQYERHAAADGYLSRRERATIRYLKDELADKCGGFRWRG